MAGTSKISLSVPRQLELSDSGRGGSHHCGQLVRSAGRRFPGLLHWELREYPAPAMLAPSGAAEITRRGWTVLVDLLTNPISVLKFQRVNDRMLRRLRILIFEDLRILA